MTRELPFRQFVLKVHSRCDLACDHCYVYEHADQSWRTRPRMMSERVTALVANRIAEHAVEHRLPAVHVVLHGGEPLLLGHERARSVLRTLRERIEPVTRLDLRIHTNGVLLDEEFCALLREFGVKVGISLDGDRAANDRHRRFANGRTSHPHVLRALALLRRPEFARLYAGILCTIDIANDPVAVYEALAEQRPPRVDLLLPHATWDSPPARTAASGAEYADWLTAVYDRWIADGRPFGIRTFDSIHAALRGGPSQTESLGLDPTDLLVIETDGTLEQADSLKTAFDGAPTTGLDVTRHRLSAAARHEGIAARQQGVDGLCDTCRSCPVVGVCGGGLYAHRFRSGSGFANPSVYCADLKATIVHIETTGTPVAPTGSTHTLSAAEFDTLACGYGSPEAVTGLAEAQDSIRRELIATLLRETRSAGVWAAAGDLIVQLDVDAPEDVSAVLAHPATRRWAEECLDALALGEAEPDRIRYMGNLAVAAAARTGVHAEFPVSALDGAVHLPTLGYAEVGGRGEVTAAVSGSSIEITQPGYTQRLNLDDPRPNPAWHPVPRLRSAELTLFVEHTIQCPASAVATLQDTFPEAVELLAHCMPEYLPGLRAGLFAIVPQHAAFCDTVGAVSVAPTADRTMLAIRLLRAFQRTKLHGVLDMFKLLRTGGAEAESALYAAYEQLAVAEFRRAQHERMSGGENGLALARFHRERRAASNALERVRGRVELTDLGRHFAEGMARTVANWSAPDLRVAQ